MVHDRQEEGVFPAPDGLSGFGTPASRPQSSLDQRQRYVFSGIKE